MCTDLVRTGKVKSDGMCCFAGEIGFELSQNFKIGLRLPSENFLAEEEEGLYNGMYLGGEAIP
jgi:hypothetical protein